MSLERVILVGCALAALLGGCKNEGTQARKREKAPRAGSETSQSLDVIAESAKRSLSGEQAPFARNEATKQPVRPTPTPNVGEKAEATSAGLVLDATINPAVNAGQILTQLMNASPSPEASHEIARLSAELQRVAQTAEAGDANKGARERLTENLGKIQTHLQAASETSDTVIFRQEIAASEQLLKELSGSDGK